MYRHVLTGFRKDPLLRSSRGTRERTRRTTGGSTFFLLLSFILGGNARGGGGIYQWTERTRQFSWMQGLVPPKLNVGEAMIVQSLV